MNKVSLILGLGVFFLTKQISVSAQTPIKVESIETNSIPAIESNLSSSDLTLTPDLKVDLPSFDRNLDREPIPGTVATGSELLFASPNQKNESNDKNSTIAQRDIQLGRIIRHDYTWVGIGINVGFSGDDSSPIGDVGFAVNSKIALARNLSLRPSVVFNGFFNGDTAFLIPVTYDFTIPGSDPFELVPIVPFVGGGIALTTGDDNSIGFLVSGGIDYRFSSRVVANAEMNVGFLSDTTDVGLILSIGYILGGY